MRHAPHSIVCTNTDETQRFTRSARWLLKLKGCPCCGKPIYTAKGFSTTGHTVRREAPANYSKFYAPSGAVVV